MRSSPVAFVGDVHGMDVAVDPVLEEFCGKRHLVFLGDYVNRGPNSRAVVQKLLDAQRNFPDHLTMLRGNHDQAVLDFLRGGDLSTFIALGGLSTVASYTSVAGDDIRGDFERAIPESHVAFLEGLSDYFERDDIFASHCGPNPADPTSRTRGDVALGSHPALFAEHGADVIGKPIVCGHYVQRGGRAYVGARLAALDTGHGSLPDAPLTVLLWPERTIRTYGVRT
ncbi:metallophosphoesterase [Nocardia arizonensis]|uniref:metallophosphoesterase n=1 Tax=Nocardia arizonensis TaxID=1141647 RepID=UPI0006D1631B|nr:metallophosphoesterase [Nocardia arizonensis]